MPKAASRGHCPPRCRPTLQGALGSLASQGVLQVRPTATFTGVPEVTSPAPALLPPLLLRPGSCLPCPPDVKVALPGQERCAWHLRER